MTALFADVVGSTQLTERMDPEDAREVLGGAVRRMVDAVEAFGGTVKDLAGDGILALFGAPVTHEDDAERAIRAALRIVERTDDGGSAARDPGRHRDRARGARADRRGRPGRVRRDRRRAEHRRPPAVARVARMRPRRRRDAPGGRRPVRVGAGAAARAEGQGRAGPGVRGDRRATRRAVRIGPDPDGRPRARVRTRRDDRRPRARRRGRAPRRRRGPRHRQEPAGRGAARSRLGLGGHVARGSLRVVRRVHAVPPAPRPGPGRAGAPAGSAGPDAGDGRAGSDAAPR